MGGRGRDEVEGARWRRAGAGGRAGGKEGRGWKRGWGRREGKIVEEGVE